MRRSLVLFALALAVVSPATYAAERLAYYEEEQTLTVNPDGTASLAYQEVFLNGGRGPIVTRAGVLDWNLLPETAKGATWTDLAGAPVTVIRTDDGLDADAPPPIAYTFASPVPPGGIGGLVIRAPDVPGAIRRVGDHGLIEFGPYRARSCGAPTMLTLRFRLPRDFIVVKVHPEAFSAAVKDDAVEIVYRKRIEGGESTGRLFLEFALPESARLRLKPDRPAFYAQRHRITIAADLTATHETTIVNVNRGTKPLTEYGFRNDENTLIRETDAQGRELKVDVRPHPDGHGYAFTVALIDPVPPGAEFAVTSTWAEKESLFRAESGDVVIYARGPHSPIPPTDYVETIETPRGTRLAASLLEPVTVREEKDRTVFEVRRHLAYMEHIGFALVMNIPGVSDARLRALPVIDAEKFTGLVH